MDRRSFVTKSSLVGMGLLAGNRAFAADADSGRPIVVFTKSLEDLPFDELAAKISTLGVAGLEAPLRDNGHIKPGEMVEKLPAFTAALAKRNLSVLIMASSINKVDKEGLTEKQLRAAAAAGIKKYRLQHLHYDLKKPLKPQIANFKAQLEDLAALNKEVGIQGLYQNHRGRNFVGGPIWDMVGMLEDTDPAHLGMVFDFAHATVEGANAWEMNFHLAQPHIGAVFFKDYKLEGRTWQPCPLGEGCVNPSSAKLAAEKLSADIPISIHIEYIRGEGVPPRMIEAMKNDLATLRKWLA